MLVFFRKIPECSSSKSVQEIHTTVRLLQQWMLYGTPQKSCLFYVFAVPSFLCIKCPSKIVPPWNACCTNCCCCCTDCQIRTVRPPQNCYFLFLKSVHRNLLYDPQEIRTVRPSHSTIPSSISVLLGCLGNRALTLQMLSCQARPLSLALSTRGLMNNPRMGAPSCPSRPHEGRWGVF